MANVSQPILPTRLYRYRGLTRSANAIDQEVDAISENYIYCSDFEGMNDPMEGFFRPSKLLKGSAEYRDIARDIVSSKSAIGIASLTETYDSSLMWAHYASNYSGICVEYSTQDLLDCLSDAVCLVRLAYVDNPLLVLPKLARNADNAAKGILSQKHFSWAYEREWRVLAHIGKVPLGRRSPVREILMGSRISGRHRRKVLEAAEKRGIVVREMEIDGYEHCWSKDLTPDETPQRSRARQ